MCYNETCIGVDAGKTLFSLIFDIFDVLCNPLFLSSKNNYLSKLLLQETYSYMFRSIFVD